MASSRIYLLSEHSAVVKFLHTFFTATNYAKPTDIEEGVLCLESSLNDLGVIQYILESSNVPYKVETDVEANYWLQSKDHISKTFYHPYLGKLSQKGHEAVYFEGNGSDNDSVDLSVLQGVAPFDFSAKLPKPEVSKIINHIWDVMLNRETHYQEKKTLTAYCEKIDKNCIYGVINGLSKALETEQFQSSSANKVLKISQEIGHSIFSAPAFQKAIHTIDYTHSNMAFILSGAGKLPITLRQKFLHQCAANRDIKLYCSELQIKFAKAIVELDDLASKKYESLNSLRNFACSEAKTTDYVDRKIPNIQSAALREKAELIMSKDVHGLSLPKIKL